MPNGVRRCLRCGERPALLDFLDQQERLLSRAAELGQAIADEESAG